MVRVRGVRGEGRAVGVVGVAGAEALSATLGGVMGGSVGTASAEEAGDGEGEGEGEGEAGGSVLEGEAAGVPGAPQPASRMP